MQVREIIMYPKHIEMRFGLDPFDENRAYSRAKEFANRLRAEGYTIKKINDQTQNGSNDNLRYIIEIEGDIRFSLFSQERGFRIELNEETKGSQCDSLKEFFYTLEKILLR